VYFERQQEEDRIGHLLGFHHPEPPACSEFEIDKRDQVVRRASTARKQSVTVFLWRPGPTSEEIPEESGGRVHRADFPVAHATKDGVMCIIYRKFRLGEVVAAEVSRALPDNFLLTRG
jgi:hypothetical protein